MIAIEVFRPEEIAKDYIHDESAKTEVVELRNSNASLLRRSSLRYEGIESNALEMINRPRNRGMSFVSDHTSKSGVEII